MLVDVVFSEVALPHALARLAMDPDGVDQVVIGDAHPDHAGASG